MHPQVANTHQRFPSASKDTAWLAEKLKQATPDGRDFLNAWTTGEPMNKIPYVFYFDDKYHWIVKHPNGQEQVVDPDLWAKFFGLTEMYDGSHFFATEAVDAFYGSLRIELELQWLDGRMVDVSLCAPDGDPIKQDIKRFHITRDELI